MNKSKIYHRSEKLYDKLLSESGPRWQNRWEREQRIIRLMKQKNHNH